MYVYNIFYIKSNRFWQLKKKKKNLIEREYHICDYYKTE